MLQRALTFSGLFNLPIPVPILDVCARLGVGGLETGGSIFPTCNSTSAPARTPQVFSHRLSVFSRTETAFLYRTGLQVRLAATALCVEFERLSDSHGGPDLLSVGALWTFWECRICFFAFSVPDTHEVRFKTGHLVGRAFERP